MRNTEDYIALVLLAIPLFLFRVMVIPIRLLGYAIKITMYKDTGG